MPVAPSRLQEEDAPRETVAGNPSVKIGDYAPYVLKPRQKAMSQKHERVVAIYPGSFDPITSGHLDVIQRGARLFDKLIVSILRNESKAPLFSLEERMEMLTEAVQPYGNVEVDSFEGLLAEYALRKGARGILRGIRAISDYEYELQMALMNKRLRPEIETVFLMADPHHQAIAARLVKEIAKLDGDISAFVTPNVAARLRAKVGRA